MEEICVYEFVYDGKSAFSAAPVSIHGLEQRFDVFESLLADQGGVQQAAGCGPEERGRSLAAFLPRRVE